MIIDRVEEIGNYHQSLAHAFVAKIKTYDAHYNPSCHNATTNSNLISFAIFGEPVPRISVYPYFMKHHLLIRDVS